MATPAVGIDLGTTFSCLAYKLPHMDHPEIRAIQGRRTTPSVVYFGEGNPIVGQTAKDKLGSTERVRVLYNSKRIIGRRFNQDAVQEEIRRNPPFKLVDNNGYPEYSIDTAAGTNRRITPEAVSAEILKTMMREATAALGAPPQEVVITCPAYFEAVQRMKTEEAARLAGFAHVHMLEEPVAAANAYGASLPPGSDKTILVFDFGGGTLDITIVRIETGVRITDTTVISVAGNSHLGGEDIDNALLNYVAPKVRDRLHLAALTPRQMYKLKLRCEQAKIHLSGENVNTYDVTFPYLSPDGDEETLSIPLTRAELNEQCNSIFQQGMALVDEALRKAKDKLGVPSVRIDDVVLAGGSSAIPRIRELLSAKFHQPVNTTLNADEAIALGAAYRAADFCGHRRHNEVHSVVPLSLGVQIVGNRMIPILHSGDDLTDTKTEHFGTAVDNQTEVRIRIREGDSTVASENTFVGSFVLSGIEPGPKARGNIAVTFECDENRHLHVAALDTATGRRIQSHFSLDVEGEVDRYLYMLILDQSGSMSGYRQQVIDGFNNILHLLDDAQDDGEGTEEHYLSLILFNDTVRSLYTARSLHRTYPLSEATFQPSGGTALLDGIGQGITELDTYLNKYPSTTVKMTIITDGQENVSKRFTRDSVRALIQARIGRGWDIQYLGSDPESFQLAREIGIFNPIRFDASPAGVETAFHNLHKELTHWAHRR